MEWQPIETWDRRNNWVVLFQPAFRLGKRSTLSARPVMPGSEGSRLTTHWMPLPTPPDVQQPGGVVAQGGEG